MLIWWPKIPKDRWVNTLLIYVSNKVTKTSRSSQLPSFS